MRQLLRVNMTTGQVSREDLPGEWMILGGRALSDAVLAAEVDPTCHPLGVNNKLILAPGLFAGTAMPTSARLSVGGKSPLTGGIKESNVGGNAAQFLTRMGLAAIVVEGASGELMTLALKGDSAELKPAGELAGLGNYPLAAKIRAEYGDKACVISIGQAGEMGQALASVAVTDVEGRPCRHAGRGGLGAVMGAKGLKAVVIDPEGLKIVKGENPEAFSAAVKEFARAVTSGGSLQFFQTYGTAGVVDIASGRGSLPTRNYTQGAYDKKDTINGDALLKLTGERGGTTGHPCMTGCAVRCSNIFNDEQGRYVTSGLEYETICLLGSNLDIDSLDTIAQLDYLCDDYGVDTIETGAAIATLSATDEYDLGDHERAIELLHEIGRGTVLGRVLGQGAAGVAKVYGLSRVPTVKGQSFPAHAPRALKGIGLTYATSPQGADHTAGFVDAEPLSAEGHAPRSRDAQIRTVMVDSLGLCTFNEVRDPEMFAKLASSLLGREVSAVQIEEIGVKYLKVEHEFNLAAGIGPGQDRLPEFMLVDKLPPNDTVWDVSKEDIAAVFGDYPD